MKRMIFALAACAAFAGPAWAQRSNTAEVIDGPSIFSQDRVASGTTVPTGARGDERAATPAAGQLVYAGVIVEGSSTEALLEIVTPLGPQFQLVRAGDEVAGYRVLVIGWQHVELSDGQRTYGFDLGHNLLNQEPDNPPARVSGVNRPRRIGLQPAPTPRPVGTLTGF